MSVKVGMVCLAFHEENCKLSQYAKHARFHYHKMIAADWLRKEPYGSNFARPDDRVLDTLTCDIGYA